MKILYAFIEKEKHNYLFKKYLDINGKAFKDRLLIYRRWQDAQLSLLGRVLLKIGLKKFYNINDINIYFNSYNKPFLERHDIFFNISHAKNIVVCVFADFTIGIDIEYIDKSINYIDFQRQMTQSEFEKIHNSPHKIRSFFKYWTGKEAVIKACGKGLSIPLDSFEISQKKCFLENETFYLKNLYINETYACSIAANNSQINNDIILIKRINLECL